MLYWKLAFRNLFRHKTRLILNLILLVGAFTSIVVFKGFKTYVLGTMRDVIVETQLGHVQVARPQFWNNSPVNRVTDKMIGDSSGLIQKLTSLQGVQYISPRVAFYGLINTETKSLPTKFVGFNPELETKLQPRLNFIEGVAFSQPRQAIVSSGLQKNLKIKPGDDVTIVSPTLDGSINAVDIKITGVFQTGFTEMDTATVFLSLKDAQKVLDSDYVDNLIIVVKDRDQAENTQKQAQSILANAGSAATGGELEVKTWRDLSGLYSQVEAFFNFQNTVIEVILLVLLLLSVSNTMSMTVFERLSEIGTLRALGDYEKDIRQLFLIESVLLGALATIISVPISYFVVEAISRIAVPVVLPLASRPMPLQVVAYPGSYIEAIFVCFFSIVMASLWPAKKGSQISIVEALRAKT